MMKLLVTVDIISIFMMWVLLMLAGTRRQ